MVGFCGCGCGQITGIAAHNDKRRGWVKGQPKLFLQWHHARNTGRKNWTKPRFFVSVPCACGCGQHTFRQFVQNHPLCITRYVEPLVAPLCECGCRTPAAPYIYKHHNRHRGYHLFAKGHGRKRGPYYRTLRRAVKASHIRVRTYHSKCHFCGTWSSSDSPTILQRECCNKRVCRTARRRQKFGLPLRDAEFTCKGCGKQYTTSKIAQKNFCPECKPLQREHRVQHENVNKKKVFERDDWTCRHCGYPTPDWFLGTTPTNDNPELDHILPISQGGAHSYANTQCLCRGCNAKKADKIENEPRLKGVTDLRPYMAAKNHPQRQTPNKPRICDCGCNATYTPWVNGNAQFKSGHWNNSAERRAAARTRALAQQDANYAHGKRGGRPKESTMPCPAPGVSLPMFAESSAVV